MKSVCLRDSNLNIETEKKVTLKNTKRVEWLDIVRQYSVRWCQADQIAVTLTVALTVELSEKILGGRCGWGFGLTGRSDTVAFTSLRDGWAGHVHLKEEKEPGRICKGIWEEEAGSTIPREARAGSCLGCWIGHFPSRHIRQNSRKSQPHKPASWHWLRALATDCSRVRRIVRLQGFLKQLETSWKLADSQQRSSGWAKMNRLVWPSCAWRALQRIVLCMAVQQLPD